MANFVKNIFDNPKVFAPVKREDLINWRPSYPDLRKVVDFANKETQVTSFNAKTGKAVVPQGGKSIAQQVAEDQKKKASERAIVSVEANPKYVGFNVLDYGVSVPVAKYIPRIQVPSQPWEMKLEYSAAEIKSGFDFLQSMVPGNFPTKINEFGVPVFEPQAMGEFMVKAAENFVVKMKIPDGANIVAAMKSGVMSDTYVLLKTLPDSLHKNTLVVMEGASQITSLATVDFWGGKGSGQAGVEGLMMTISSLQDGMITKDEAAKIGASFGGFIGGAVGSIFGPVGAAVGSAIGSLIGKLFGTIVGAKAGASEEWFEARDRKSEQDAAEKALSAKIKQMETQIQENTWDLACVDLQAKYYASLEAYMRLVAKIWADMEIEVGWRFDLRWFDPNPGVNFNLLKAPYVQSICHPSSVTKSFWGQNANYAEVANRPMSMRHEGMSQVQVTATSNECHTTCPQTYGCPYPVVPIRQVIPTESYYPNTGKRVAEAFAARGFVWEDLSSRTSCKSLRIRGAELDWLMQQSQQLHAAAKLIMLDVQRTAIAVQVEHDMWKNAAAYKRNGIDTGAIGKLFMEQAVKEGKITDKNILNNPHFKGYQASYQASQWAWYGGLGALGLVAFDQWRRRR